MQKKCDDDGALSPLTLGVTEEHFEELERAFFAAGEDTADETSHVVPERLHRRLITHLAWARVWVTARLWRGKFAGATGASALLRRMAPTLRVAQFWVGAGVRLLGNALLGAMPSRLERLSARRFGGRLVRPFLVWSGEQLPRLRNRRPGLVLAATVVLVSTVGSLWAAVVLAATRLGR